MRGRRAALHVGIASLNQTIESQNTVEALRKPLAGPSGRCSGPLKVEPIVVENDQEAIECSTRTDGRFRDTRVFSAA